LLNLLKTKMKLIYLHHLTIPSLQCALAKRIKSALQPNFAKEPFRPSHSNPGLRDTINLLNKLIENKNRQCQTSHIKDSWVGGLQNFVYLNQKRLSRDRNAAMGIFVCDH
jgi:hypothetical protein